MARITIRVLGFDLLEISTDPAVEYAEDDGAALNGGTTASYPIGFSADHGDARWDKCADYGYGDE